MALTGGLTINFKELFRETSVCILVASLILGDAALAQPIETGSSGSHVCGNAHPAASTSAAIQRSKPTCAEITAPFSTRLRSTISNGNLLQAVAMVSRFGNRQSGRRLILCLPRV